MITVPARSLTLYRVLCSLLLLLLAALGQALHVAVGERESAVAQLARTQQPAQPVPQQPAPVPPKEEPALTPVPATIAVRDTGTEVADLMRAGSDKGDQVKWLFRTALGGVALVSLGYRHLVPLHIHDATYEADLPLTGAVHIDRVAPQAPRSIDGRRGGRPERSGAGTLAFFPPFAGHRLVNGSSDQIGVVLSFLSAPADGPIYIDEDDDRLQLGDSQHPPALLEPTKELAALRDSGQPYRLSWLPMMRGQLASLAVAGEAALAPLPVPAAAYVVAGKGLLGAQPEQALAAGGLITIPAGAPLRLKAAGEPLVVLLYAPGRDGVSEILRSGTKLYSQENEELVIRDFFQDRKDGVFLDVGAGHYRRYSTTYYLEERLGWSGVSVDARAELAEGYREHRPRTRFMNYLVTDKAQGQQKFYRTEKIPELSSMSEKLAHDQILHHAGEDKVTELVVPTISLNELLQQLKVTKLDFLSMDIEEHEPEALAGFDVERYRPELVCIEVHQMVRDRIAAYFTRHGYVRLDQYLPYDSENWYFAPRPAQKK